MFVRMPRFSRFSRVGRLVSVVAVAATAGLVLSGCASAASPSTGGELNVVATTTQVGDFTQAVGGDHIHLTTLFSPGASAHAFEPTQADMIALADADVLVINGAGLETFIDTAVETSGFSGTIIDASTGLQLDADDHDHETEAEHAEHDHDHGETNPHIWTAPLMASQMVKNIADGMAKAKPTLAEAFQENAHDYEQQLILLDAWIAENMAQVPEEERLFVSGHDSLHYFLEAYDIEFVGSLLPGFEDNAEPSLNQINELIEKINDLGVRAIFVESSINPKTAALIAKETGATLVDHDVIYVDSLGAAGSGAETYIAATLHNTRAILEAWGVTPTELPTELR